MSIDSSRLVDLIPCAALLYSGEETILAANSMFCDLLGYSEAELAQRRVADLITSQDRPRDGAARAQFIARSGDVIRCEVTRKRIDEAGQPLALVRPEPERVRGDDELILHAINEGFVLLDREFRILQINDEALRIDGRPRSEMLGRTHWEVWPGSEQLPLADAYRKAMRERVQIDAEQVYSHNGQDMWIEARAFPVADGLAVFYRDITERKQAERALRESEATFRTMADAMPQIVWSTRADGFHDYFNRQWYDFTGVPENSATGDAWVGLFHPDDVQPMQERWQHSLATGEPYETEFRLRHRSGEY
ncbi:PAS domain S-box protein, partial [Pseudoduganella sp. RAF53_2]